MQKRKSQNNRFYRYVGKENNLCLQGRDLCARSPLWPGCMPHLTLTSPGSGNGNLCAELWQYKWIPGNVFCQYFAGASSCFTAAVKNIGAPSPYSPPGTDWIGICGFGGGWWWWVVLHSGHFLPELLSTHLWNMKLPHPEAHPWVGDIHKLAVNNISPPVYMKESSVCNHSAASNFQLPFLYVFSGIWMSLESVNLQPRMIKWGPALSSSLGKLYVETTVFTSVMVKGMICRTHRGCPGRLQAAHKGYAR